MFILQLLKEVPIVLAIPSPAIRQQASTIAQHPPMLFTHYVAQPQRCSCAQSRRSSRTPAGTLCVCGDFASGGRADFSAGLLCVFILIWFSL